MHLRDGLQTHATVRQRYDHLVANGALQRDGAQERIADRLDRLIHDIADKRIARIGAISSAAMQAAINTAGLSGRNRVGVGVGFQGGERALSIGYQRIVRPNFSVSLGGGFAGNDRQAGVGAGFSW